jgi:protein-S-isoprenylcysteine O-methyltransferase Ste14
LSESDTACTEEAEAAPAAAGRRRSLWDSWQEFAVRRRTAFTLVFLVPLVVFARPVPTWYALGAALTLVGIVIRVLAAGFIMKKVELTTTGPFAHTRNPLYLGSLLIAAGAVAMSGRAIAAPIVLVSFGIIYATVILDEERVLREAHGATYSAYGRAVPRIVPRLRVPAGAWQGFSWNRVWLNKEHLNVLGVTASALAFAIRFVFP